jgi:hypothetical protein
MSSADRNDVLWICVAALFVLALGSLPTWAGYQFETEDFRFRGLYYDSQDYAAHIAMMEAGRNGEWAYQFRFTTETFEPVYIRIFYILLGHISGWLALPSEFAYHLFRWVLGFLALFALYRLTRQIFESIFWARTAFLLAALGSGLGWLQLIFNLTSSQITPIDFWLIDPYVFFSLSVFPHFAFVTAAMCFTLILWLRYLENPDRDAILWIVLLTISVQLTNPIAFAALDAGFFGAAVFDWWRNGRISRPHVIGLSILALAQLPLLAYNVSILAGDPLWRQYTSQHQTPSPPPDYYIWGFAVFWPFAVWGGVRALKEKSNAQGAALFWTLTAFVLAYTPLYTQQRFLQNITIPLGILATQGLMGLFEAVSIRRLILERWKPGVVMLLVCLASFSSIQLSLGRALFLQNNPQTFYYPASLDEAAHWLREHAHYQDVVLASEQTSQVLAQKAGVRVYFGHEMETLDYEDKRKEVEAFFQGDPTQIAGQPIQWVVYGPYERELVSAFQPPARLEFVYEAQGVQIYQVK